MGPEMLRQAVAMVDGRAVTEASGRISPTPRRDRRHRRRSDLVGWLTHSAQVLDIGLDIA